MPNQQTLPRVKYDGQQAYVAAYADDPDWRGVVYLSLIGYRASCRAIWAAIMDGRWVEYDRGAANLRRIEGVPYRTHAVALPENGLTHFTMLSVQATRFLTRGDAFYVLKETNDTDERLVQRFVGLLDLAAGVPLLPQWAEELWHAGLDQEYGLIAPCERAAGIDAWRVDADSDAWLAVVKAGIERGTLHSSRIEQSEVQPHLSCTERSEVQGHLRLRQPQVQT